MNSLLSLLGLNEVNLGIVKFGRKGKNGISNLSVAICICKWLFFMERRLWQR